MPYKDPTKQRQAQIIIQRRYRKKQREAKKKLALQFPDIYLVIFGKPLPRRTKKK